MSAVGAEEPVASDAGAQGVAAALRALTEAGTLRPLDAALGAWVARVRPGEEGDEGAATAALAAALASAATADGHTAWAVPEEPPWDAAVGVRWPGAAAVRAAVAASPVVGRSVADGRPLVWQGERLQLLRHAAAEARVAAALRARAALRRPSPDPAARDALIGQLFAGSWANPEQEAAVRAASEAALLVLAGGPGTGKTTTVVALLVVLAAAARAAGEPVPSVLLLAPTGKAAARLAESVAGQRARLREAGVDPALLAAVPDTASTLHRALRPANAFLTRWRHGAEQPWPHDIVLIDEVSMVDLALLDHALAATRPAARVVLLGDPGQLASVGAGSALADVVTAGGPVAGCVHTLTRSRRFPEDSAIGRLARAVRGGDADAALAVLDAGASGAGIAVGWGARAHDGARARRRAAVDEAVAAWRPVLEATSPSERLAGLTRHRVLCAVRRGPDGVEGFNAAIRAGLVEAGLLRRPVGLEDGVPLLITATATRASCARCRWACGPSSPILPSPQAGAPCCPAGCRPMSSRSP